jgi:diguanylate cyclase (GGDEF)-like protein/PAS domain S-box-containing protein
VADRANRVKVNNKLCNIVGYSEEQLLKLTFQDITHPEDLEADIHLVNQILKGEINQYTLEKRYVRADGELIWINLSVSLLRDSSGRPLHFISVIEDIQARKETDSALRRLRRELEERVQTRTAQLQQSNDSLSITIEQLHRSEDSLRAREAQLSAVLENAQDAYVAINQHGLITQWNRQAEVTFDWPRDEAIGRRLDDTIIPIEYREAHRNGMKRFMETGAAKVLNKRLELTARRRDGSMFPVEIRISPLPSETGHLFCAFLHDISERKRAEQALLNSQEQLRTIANNLPVQISYVDADLVVRFVNEAYRNDVGIAPELAVGKKLIEVVNKPFYQSIQIHLERVLAGERVHFETTTNIRKQERIWDSVYIPDRQNGHVAGFYIMSQDITARKLLETSLEYKANRDALTGLPNRNALLERLGTAVARANRSNQPLAVLFLDLDGFKAINDRYGHDGGDNILKQFANRLTQCVRETDTVARLAGDEFVIVLELVKQGEVDAKKVATKILQAMREPFLVNNVACTMGTSIGICVRESDCSMNPEEMIAQADQAMYRAKRAGKNRLYLAEAS